MKFQFRNKFYLTSVSRRQHTNPELLSLVVVVLLLSLQVIMMLMTTTIMMMMTTTTTMMMIHVSCCQCQILRIRPNPDALRIGAADDGTFGIYDYHRTIKR